MTGPVLRPWKGAHRDPRFLSDAARYKQAGNAVAVPVIAETAAALTDRTVPADEQVGAIPPILLPPQETR